MTVAISLFRRLTTRIRLRPAMLAAAIAVAAMTALPACTGNGTLRIGPFGILIPAGEGSLVRDLFLKKVVVSNKEEVCDLPSEADLAAMVSNVGYIDLSNIIAISDLDLVQTVVTATSGNFGFLTEMTVRWIPAPINGQEQDPVVLGTASDPNGFGSVVVLVPTSSVDLIDLIRLNDMNTSGDCPEIEIEVDANGVPAGDVEYIVDLDIDAHVEIG